MRRFNFQSLCIKAFSLAAIASLVMPLNLVNAQDEKEDHIIIVNQDGEKVGANELKIQVQATDTDGKGKIIVVDENGEKREIDVSNARSVIINRAVESIMKDGEKKTQVKGKVVVVGPDGVKREFDLDDEAMGKQGMLFLPQMGDMKGLREKLRLGAFGDDLKVFRGNLDLELENGLPFEFNVQRANVSKYMIGVNCKPVGDVLRTHLDLTPDVGLVVENVSPDSPAQKAGLEKHDILMYADQTELKVLKDLVEVVKKAGEKDRAVSFTVIRKGSDQGIKIKPIERPASSGVGQLRFHQAGPGMIVDQFKGDEDFNRQIQKMQKEIQQKMMEMQRNQRHMMDDMNKKMKEMTQDRMKRFEKNSDQDSDSDKDSDRDDN